MPQAGFWNQASAADINRYGLKEWHSSACQIACVGKPMNRPTHCRQTGNGAMSNDAPQMFVRCELRIHAAFSDLVLGCPNNSNSVKYHI